MAKFKELLDSSDVGDALKLIEGTTGESMKHLQEEIDFFLEDKEAGEQSQKDFQDSSNPFTALIGGYDSQPSMEKKKEWKKPKETIKPENYVEREYLRKQASKSADEFTFRLFDTYKKAHGMPSWT